MADLTSEMIDKINSNMREMERSLDAAVAHTMFFHSGSKYDLTCTTANCPDLIPPTEEFKNFMEDVYRNMRTE